MLNLYELEQFVAFSNLGTLSRVSEQLHISQPTITRSMQNLETEFGVELFIRSKNKLELNENGKLAVTYARGLLNDANQAVTAVRAYDKSKRTITVCSCAPAPLWTLLPKLNSAFPNMSISSCILSCEDILATLAEDNCDLAILPFKVHTASFAQAEYVAEHLSITVKKDHPLSMKSEVTFSDLNGYNFLLRSDNGFWEKLCRDKMPSSKFLVQNNDSDLEELINHSTLPGFITDLASSHAILTGDRVAIPVTDVEANVTYYIASNHPERFGMFFVT